MYLPRSSTIVHSIPCQELSMKHRWIPQSAQSSSFQGPSGRLGCGRCMQGKETCLVGLCFVHIESRRSQDFGTPTIPLQTLVSAQMLTRLYALSLHFWTCLLLEILSHNISGLDQCNLKHKGIQFSLNQVV